MRCELWLTMCVWPCLAVASSVASRLLPHPVCAAVSQADKKSIDRYHGRQLWRCVNHQDWWGTKHTSNTVLHDAIRTVARKSC